MISNINERTTRSRSRNASHFAHSAFVATLEPKDSGHVLSAPNWVNAMHVELQNFERNHAWELVEPPPNCKPIGKNCRAYTPGTARKDEDVLLLGLVPCNPTRTPTL
jgi:hypothetical protein